MSFWDASAIVPLLLPEKRTSIVRAAYGRGPEMSVWWATEVECVSAIARQLRHATVELEDANEGYARLEWLAAQWSVIEPSRSIRQHAISLLQTHDLRAADALQLAAAFVAAEGSPSTLEFVCLDDRLTDAARAEGFGIAIDNRG